MAGSRTLLSQLSYQYEGVSLNDALLTGPDLNNRRPGALMHFTKEAVVITVDIQQMFQCFVRPQDREREISMLTKA